MELYIEGNRVELFKDENISMTSSIANLKDISKVFTDFTQVFSVPASPVNNKIFKHWYNAEIDGGFDARISKDATIELLHQPFKTGKVRLESAKKINGVISSYRITFIGNLIKLNELFEDDLLTDLDLSAYTHAFNSDEVKAGIENNGDYIYPLISPERIWTVGDSADTDIQFSTATATSGLQWNELKPAIKWKALTDAVQVKYNIQFIGGFLDSPEFNEVYMWASKEKGLMKAYGDAVKQYFVGVGTNTSNNQSTFVSGTDKKTIFNWSVIPEAGYEDVPYTLIKRINGVDIPIQSKGLKTIGHSSPLGVQDIIEIWIQSADSFSWKCTGSFDDLPPDALPRTWVLGETSVQDSTGTVYFSDEVVGGVLNAGQLPKLKIIDFLKSLIKAFNLVIIPEGKDRFRIKKLKQWYEEAELVDLSSYIDLSTEEVIRPDIYRSISFKYAEPKTILQDRYEDSNGDYYGDLEVDTIFEGTDFEIALPFEQMMFSRLSDASGVLTNIHVGSAIDSSLEPVKTSPINFYRAGEVTPTFSIGLRQDDDSLHEITNYQVVGNENALESDEIEYSLNWGSEVSSYTLTPISASLFESCWNDYITAIYDENFRKFIFRGILPSHVLSQLQLNSKIVINNRRYLINQMDTNLSTGEVKFELFNDVLDIPFLPDSDTGGLEYGLEFGLE